MKQKFIAGFLSLALVLALCACGGADKDGIMTLEPESAVRSGTPDNTGAGTAGTGTSADTGTAANTGTSAGAGASKGIGASAGAGTSAGAGASAGTGTSAGAGASAGTGASEGTGTAAGETVPAESREKGNAAPAPDESGDIYRRIYAQAVMENTDSEASYSLIYLDEGDIPELAVHDMGYDSYSIYTVKDGALFCMADAMSTVELTYFEQRNIIAAFARWNGGGDEGGYGESFYQTAADRTLAWDDSPTLSYSYNAVYNEKGIYTGEGVTTYYYMGQETDEAAYQKMLASLGIAGNDDKLCMENALGKEEMLALLNP